MALEVLRNTSASSSSSNKNVFAESLKPHGDAALEEHEFCGSNTATTATFTEIIVYCTISMDHRAISWERAPTHGIKIVDYNLPLKFKKLTD